MGLPEPVSASYRKLVEGGAIRDDAGQRRLAAALDGVLAQRASGRRRAGPGALGRLFGAKAPAQKSGLYIYGPVGGGKTLLMDLFFAAAPGERKRRAHFQEFMQEVHGAIHAHRQAYAAGETRIKDPVAPAVAAILGDRDLLCLDEFAVNDIADAMLLARLFQAMLARGVFVVATSNLAPADQYRDGLNRQLFLPFVRMLEQRLELFRLDSSVDYRLENAARGQAYLTPLGERIAATMEAMWRREVDGHAETRERLDVGGRSLWADRVAGNAAWFTFAQLCEEARGAADYLAVAERFATVFLYGVPRMDQTMRNEARRFILLIDTLYDRRVRLVIAAQAHPQALYSGNSGAEAVEFGRTASRLIEMQGEAWMEKSRRHPATGDKVLRLRKSHKT